MPPTEYDEYVERLESQRAHYKAKQELKEAGLKRTLHEYRKIIPDNIPPELKALKQWTVFKVIKGTGGSKDGKKPMYRKLNPLTSEYDVKAASLSDPETYMTFDDAYEFYKSSAVYKGLQFVLPGIYDEDYKVKRLVGVDLDNAMEDDGVTLKPEIKEIIEAFNSYTEISPSGTGIRIFCYGYFPFTDGVHNGNFEIYQCGKLLTVTGHHIVNTSESINDAQEAIEVFRAKYFKSFDDIDESNLPTTPIELTDEEILSRLHEYKLAEQFKKLYYGERKEGDDWSELDKDLCKLICFFTQKAEQIDRIFRGSALIRDKWDQKRGHDSKGPITYGQRTINFVLKTRKVVYNTGVFSSTNNIEEYSLKMYPFNVEKNGIYKEVYSSKSDESVLVQITSTPCLIVAIGENIDNGKILYKLKIRDIKGNDKYVWKSAGELLKRSEVLKLQDDELVFTESKVNDLIDYFNKFINTFYSKLVSEFAASVGGWKKGFSMYVIGNRVITKDAVNEILQLDNPTANLYTMKGSVEGWVEGAKYIAGYHAVRFKMYNSCVAPLIRILYLTSYILDNHVESGRLKSVSNWLSASMWGDPIAQQAGGNSTAVGIMKLIEYCIDIPTFLDETGQNPEAARKLSYAVGNVGGRFKGTTDGKNGLVIPSAPATVLLATGEHPIIPENANGGEDVRVMSLTEGVYKELPTENIIKMEILMRENHGHIVVPFIQEILKLKGSIKDMYNANLAALPTISGISENRVKKQYAAVATAGQILERVFEKIGIPVMNPMEVCTRYFEMNVMNGGFTPDHIKALNVAYHWYSTNEVYFQEGDINHTQYGWIREDKKTGDTLICFDEEQLKKQIAATLGANRYESSVTKWRDLEIIKVRKIDIKDENGDKTGKVKILKTTQIKVNNRNTNVIAIPLSNFYKYLNITDDNKPENEGNNPDEGDDHDDTSAKAPDLTVEPEFTIPPVSENTPASFRDASNQVTSISTGINENIIVPDSSEDLYELMIREFGDEQ